MSIDVPAMTGQALLEAGRLRDARDQFWRDADDAVQRGDAEALAIAALGLGGIWVHEHRSTLELAQVSDLQRRALALLDPDSPLARRLSVRRAAEHAYLSGDVATIMAELASAHRQGDPLVLAEALSLAHHCLLGPHSRDLRLAIADELIAVSPATGRALDGLMGLAWRTVDLFLAGDRRATRSLEELRGRLELDRCDSLRYLVAALDVTLAIRAGRLDEAERLAGDCYQLGLDVGDADAFGWYGAQLVAIRWLQGRGRELLALVGDLVQSPTVPEPCSGFVAAVAALAASAGDLTASRAALECLRVGGLHTMPPSSIWSATMLGVCEAAHVLGDTEAAAEAYELLVPFAASPIMASLGVACFGSSHRPLGLAAWTMGDLDGAIEHLENAVIADLAIGSGPWHAMDLAALADALDLRNGPGDSVRAIEARGTAIDEARRSEMNARADEWERRLGADDGGAPIPIVLGRDGRVWQIRIGERAAVVPHTVGMEYLTRLVEHAGIGIAAIELASGHAMSCRGSSSEPVLDAHAKAMYRQRIEELRADVEDAEMCADLERAAAARAELDRFVAELARSTGFAGRSRSFADSAERARISVQKAIKRALVMITEADPTLGREIGSRVVTGMQCVYVAHPEASPTGRPPAQPSLAAPADTRHVVTAWHR